MDYLRIPLHNNKGFVLVDAEDAPLVERFSWCLSGDGRYAQAHCGELGRRFLHQLLMPTCAEPDHINGDGFDNRRSNLRPSSRAQNAKNRKRHSNNTSGFKGVSWDSRDQRWYARIYSDGKKISLGSYSDPSDAARAYDEASLIHHGGFARTNASMATG